MPEEGGCAMGHLGQAAVENVPRRMCFGISPIVSKFLGCLRSCSGKKPECLELTNEGLRTGWTSSEYVSG